MDDRRPIALAFSWLFLSVAAAYMVMPVRAAFLLTNFGNEVIPWVFMAGAFATGGAVWAFVRFAGVRRERLVGGALAALWVSLVGWWLAAPWAMRLPWLSFLFYLWTDVFSIMAVTLFWTYVDDVFTLERARTAYGPINAAACLGAMAGSWVVGRWVERAGGRAMLLASSAAFLAAIGCFLALHRWVSRRPAKNRPPERPRLPGLRAVAREVLASPFLGWLAALVCLERMVPDFSNYVFTVAAREAYPQREALAALFAHYSFWQNLACAVLSVSLTSWVFRRAGVGGALASAPLANLIGLAAFALRPTLGVAIAFNGTEGLFRYTWFKSAKEATYTVAPYEVVYKVKPYIEMFLYRFARGLAGFWILLVTGSRFLGWGSSRLAWTAAPLALFWVWNARRLGAEFISLSRGAGVADASCTR